ncbi:reverse transcriptase domain-containing protein [Tanacetum coccineum]
MARHSREAWVRTMDASEYQHVFEVRVAVDYIASTVRRTFTRLQHYESTKGVTNALAARDADSKQKWLKRVLIQFERMETVFRIRNCTVENQIKFATCTLLGSALTWWKAHVRTVGHDVAYAMTWTNLKKIIINSTDLPKGPRLRSLKVEMLKFFKVKGTDVVGYNQRFQELALMCARMFPEESDKIKKYVSGLPDMIYGSVMASKPKTMQDAIEFATELIDKKIYTFAEQQSENKIKQDDNQQQQQNKRQNTGRVYAGQSGPSAHGCRMYVANCQQLLTYEPRGALGHVRNLLCYEMKSQGSFQRICPNLKNNNCGNQGGNGNALAKVYAVGHAGTNPNSNVVTVSSNRSISSAPGGLTATLYECTTEVEQG